MRVLLLGDSHCDAAHIDFAFDKAEEFDCDTVFVVGDFGWWSNFKQGHDFLRYCALRARRAEIPLYWLDGNHEYHPDILGWIDESGRDGFIELDRHLFYSPRGNAWEWGGVRFMSLGGAFSIDRSFRDEGIDWFEDEMITEEDVEYCIENGPVDVLLTHDAPLCVDMFAQMAAAGRRMLKNEVNTIANRERIQRVVNANTPKVVVHGHWHLQYTDRPDKGLKVIGLDCNHTPSRSWTILDTKDFK